MQDQATKASSPYEIQSSPQKFRERPLKFLHDVTLQCTVEFGRTNFTIRRFLGLVPGSILELDKLQDEPMDLRVNGKLMARGEVVVINDRFGLRLTEICSDAE
ncbi:MAG: flagellar motor switch protein FliN [Deltaproteobacteria bacterium]|nr:flagellar motor switch protein FliN [Deltaproteobacteria bacterium]